MKFAFIFIGLTLLFIGCNDERYKYSDTLRNTVMTLRVGDEWKPQYLSATGMSLIEETREYTKYEFQDWTLANVHIYYTVKKNEVVAVWKNK
jgi:hypothetical protein